VVCFAVVWAGYRFSTVPISSADPSGRVTVERLAPPLVRSQVLWAADHLPVPAAGFLVGIGRVALHDRDGHFAYLFGECRDRGWWYYFPVTFFYKTPLALVALLLPAIVAAGFRESQSSSRSLWFMTGAMLAFVMTTSINIGVRHVLPLYVPICILAGAGIVATWNGERVIVRWVVTLLMSWLIVAGATAHPDYLAYFNETAAEPRTIVVDSNLDWGQDLLRLERFVRERRIRRISVLVVFAVDFGRHRIPAVWLEPHVEREGWIAVSATARALADCRSDGYRWLRAHQPVARVGESIDIYYIP
jgi:hypothetical protein